jgi:uncharacterized protein YecT (DUF1311 family)
MYAPLGDLMPRGASLLSSLVLTVVVSGCQRASDPPRVSAPTAPPCVDVTEQRELTACWGSVANHADDTLNVALGQANEAARKSSDEAATMFRDTQDLWERYRDAECDLYRRGVEGGSSESMVGSICRWRLATERLNEVRALIETWQDTP